MADTTPVVVGWKVTARLKGHGDPLTHTTSGSAIDATNAMRDWLWQMESQLEGDALKTDINCLLTSKQRPGWKHKLVSTLDGAPIHETLYYQCDWLETQATIKNWGGGGS